MYPKFYTFFKSDQWHYGKPLLPVLIFRMFTDIILYQNYVSPNNYVYSHHFYFVDFTQYRNFIK